jgi:hypothetical protein
MAEIKQSDVGRMVHVKGLGFDRKNCVLLRISPHENKYVVYIMKEEETKIVKSEEIVEVGEYIDGYKLTK